MGDKGVGFVVLDVVASVPGPAFNPFHRVAVVLCKLSPGVTCAGGRDSSSSLHVLCSSNPPRSLCTLYGIYRIYVNPIGYARARGNVKNEDCTPRGPGIRHVNRYTVHTESGSGSGSGALFIAWGFRIIRDSYCLNLKGYKIAVDKCACEIGVPNGFLKSITAIARHRIYLFFK